MSSVKQFIASNQTKISIISTSALIMVFAAIHQYTVAIGLLTGYVMGSMYEIQQRLPAKKK